MGYIDPPMQGAANDYELERTPTRVHLNHNVTPTGNVRIMITSLLDAERYPAVAFGMLYHRRWDVGEAFKRIKHRLRLEAVSGLNYLALQQDFAANILADNPHILLASAREPKNARRAEPDYRPNRTYGDWHTQTDRFYQAVCSQYRNALLRCGKPLM